MTTKEFNQKYEKFIKTGFYGLSIQNENVISFLDNIFQDLITIPNFQFTQIKLKFGVARFYSNLRSSELQSIIEQGINSYIKQ
jgi:hypothetical protein